MRLWFIAQVFHEFEELQLRWVVNLNDDFMGYFCRSCDHLFNWI